MFKQLITRKSIGKYISLFALSLVFALTIQAAPGDLDTTFSSDGKAVEIFGLGRGFINDTALQTDGKIVAVGEIEYGNQGAFGVARYNSDGSIDTTFDTDGIVITPIGAMDSGESVAIQSDGKIVVAGTSFTTSNSYFAVVRYNVDGSLDTTFAGDGILTTSFIVYVDAKSVAIQSDGKIIVSGTTSTQTAVPRQIAVARYNADGSLDTSFDSDGKVITENGSSSSGEEVVIQSDGKIIVVGSGGTSSATDFGIVRYNTNGTLDTSFDGDGKAITSMSGGSVIDLALSVVIQADGKIVAVGHVGSSNFALVRYNINGSLDTSFDTDGKLTTVFTGRTSVQGHSIIIQPDNKILVGGQSFASGVFNFTFARYNTKGSLDTTFDVDGRMTTLIGTSSPALSAVIQTDGQIIAAGFSLFNNSNSLALARFNPDGSLDTSFDTDGKVITTEVGFRSGSINSVAIQTDGKIVSAGSVFTTGSSFTSFAVTRHNADGTLDATFDGDGKLTTQIQNSSVAYSVAIQTDGKIVVGGFSSLGNNTDSTLVRYNMDGSLDTSFDGDGVVITPIGTSRDIITSVKILSDGKILVAGNTYDTAVFSTDIALARYNTDGSLDTTFDGDGIVVTPITGGDEALSMAIQADGKIVVAGFNGTSITVFEVIRYNADGSLDTSFDGDGRVTTVINGFDRAYSVAIQPDGKIVAAGATTTLSPPLIDDIAVVRYNSDGSLDTSFDGDGIVITPVGSGADVAKSVKTLPNGKIVVAGNSDNGISSDALLIRYNSDGSLDSSLWNPVTSLFGIGGIVTFDILDRRNDRLNDLAIDSNGRYVIGGDKGGLVTVARVLGDAAPTAANVSISGRVFAENGQGLRNAIVTLVDSGGQTRVARTGAFGYFHFDEIEVGQTVVISVRSKLFQFDPLVVSVNEQLNDLDFVPVAGSTANILNTKR